jgi:hypothetical protein
MEMLMETGGQETDSYLNLLMNEPALQGDGTLLITESLTFWIQDGKSLIECNYYFKFILSFN